MNLIRKITNSHTAQDEEFIMAIRKVLGYRPKKVHFYKEAFTHSSLKKVNSNGNPMNYERLEFLGDAVLDLIVGEYLYKKFSKSAEGNLFKFYLSSGVLRSL